MLVLCYGICENDVFLVMGLLILYLGVCLVYGCLWYDILMMKKII